MGIELLCIKDLFKDGITNESLSGIVGIGLNLGISMESLSIMSQLWAQSEDIERPLSTEELYMVGNVPPLTCDKIKEKYDLGKRCYMCMSCPEYQNRGIAKEKEALIMLLSKAPSKCRAMLPSNPDAQQYIKNKFISYENVYDESETNDIRVEHLNEIIYSLILHMVLVKEADSKMPLFKGLPINRFMLIYSIDYPDICKEPAAMTRMRKRIESLLSLAEAKAREMGTKNEKEQKRLTSLALDDFKAPVQKKPKAPPVEKKEDTTLLEFWKDNSLPAPSDDDSEIFPEEAETIDAPAPDSNHAATTTESKDEKTVDGIKDENGSFEEKAKATPAQVHEQTLFMFPAGEETETLSNDEDAEQDNEDEETAVAAGEDIVKENTTKTPAADNRKKEASREKEIKLQPLSSSRNSQEEKATNTKTKEEAQTDVKTTPVDYIFEIKVDDEWLDKNGFRILKDNEGFELMKAYIKSTSACSVVEAVYNTTAQEWAFLLLFPEVKANEIFKGENGYLKLYVSEKSALIQKAVKDHLSVNKRDHKKTGHVIPVASLCHRLGFEINNICPVIDYNSPRQSETLQPALINGTYLNYINEWENIRHINPNIEDVMFERALARALYIADFSSYHSTFIRYRQPGGFVFGQSFGTITKPGLTKAVFITMNSCEEESWYKAMHKLIANLESNAVFRKHSVKIIEVDKKKREIGFIVPADQYRPFHTIITRKMLSALKSVSGNERPDIRTETANLLPPAVE